MIDSDISRLDNEVRESLAQKAARGAIYLGLAQAARILLTVASAVVIARLLSPDDYGVLAMAAPAIGFVAMFQELGLTAAAIQSRTLSADESSAMFWVNVTASAVVAVLLIALAPLAAWFYGDVRAGYVTAAGAGGILISGLALQHGALLNREMRFAAISSIEVASAFLTFVAAALLAAWLRSYWALIIGTLVGTLVQTVLVWRSVKWRPHSRPSFAGARRFARFGGGITGFNIVNFAVRNADNVLIGKFVGTVSLGLYDRSYKLMMMPLQSLNGPINRLLMPMLSKMNDDPERYRRTFVFAIRALGLITIPGIAIATALSSRVMPYLLGDRWAGAGPIFFWLGLAGLFNPIGNLTGLLFVTSGRTGPFFRWGLFSAIVTLGGFAVGMLWGAEGIAASLFLTTVLRMPILFSYSVRETGVKAADLYSAQIEPMLSSSFAVAAALALAPYLSTGPLLALAFTGAYLIAAVGAFLTPAGRQTVAVLGKLMKGFAIDVAVRVTTGQSAGRSS
jgi:PST family polysaccharide transporter